MYTAVHTLAMVLITIAIAVPLQAVGVNGFLAYGIGSAVAVTATGVVHRAHMRSLN